MSAVRTISVSAVAAFMLLVSLAGCEPEVGSERWCEAMRDKPRGDWTANEALDFTRHCLFEREE
jgi:hypothetical protein